MICENLKKLEKKCIKHLLDQKFILKLEECIFSILSIKIILKLLTNNLYKVLFCQLIR